MSFVRRYLEDPGLPELLSLEGVVIIDRQPAASPIGVGTGVVIVVAEFEKGTYDPTEVFGGQDILNQYGGFGFVYDGISGNNPCARSRHADSAIPPEYWNGNGYVALAGKQYSRLILTRVDTSVGAVAFTRLAVLEGNTDYTWQLTPAATLLVSVDGAGASTVTWDAAPAVLTSGSGSYPASFAGGEYITFMVDDNTPQPLGPFTAVFASTDTTHANLVDRINAAAGYTFAATATAATTFTGRVAGTSGNVSVVSATASVLTALGISSTTSAIGTGDVANIATTTFAEVKARIEADATGTLVERDQDGTLAVASKSTTGTPKIEITGGTAATALGLPVASIATPVTGLVDGTLPAGTLVTTSGGTHGWVTVQDVAVTSTSAGPYTARVRPANDDGTETSASPGTVVVVAAMPGNMGLWAVNNPIGLVAALSESALDAAYAAAIDKTLNPNTVAKEGQIIVSARQSNAIRIKLRSNALVAASSGLAGRIAVVRPPLGTTTPTMAMSDSAQPGVGAYRDQRVVYAYPGTYVNIPIIAQLGVAGGAGFTADGNIDVGWDTWEASIMSQLPPEENPGQQTNFAANALGVERGNPSVQDLTIDHYKAFKAAGIAALQLDSGVATIYSGVTSVDPSLYPSLKNIARRRMADFIQDSLAQAMKPFVKKLNSRTRQALVIGAIDSFLKGLRSDGNPDNQRIFDFKTDYKSGNTPESLAAGLFRPIIKVKTLSSFDVIALDTEIGEGVLIIQEAA